MSLWSRGVFALVVVLLLGFLCSADTFTNRTTGQVLHGYLTSQIHDGNAVVYTVQKGNTPLKLTEWDMIPDQLGRKNKVVIIVFEQELSLQIVAESLEEAVCRAADDGPLFVLFEMNSPGGRADYVERICDRLIRTDYCPVVAFVKTGPCGGAVSGAAAVALACDKIYMMPNTTIGAAAIISPAHTFSSEKLSVAWQEYLGTLARRGGRPELLARAMVDKDIEVIEVVDKGARRFIEPAAAEPGQSVIRLWSRSGSLLTLTAAEAVQSDIAEAIAIDRADVLRKLDAAGAEVVVDDSVAESVRTFRKAKLKFNRLRNDLDGQIKRIEQTDNLTEAINLLREIRDEYKSLLSLAKRYPDLYLDVELITEQLDSAADYYQRAKVKKRALAGDANEKANTDH
jgi:membrane-bound ClpP family serine protease